MNDAEQVIRAFIDRMLSVSLVLIGQTEGGKNPQGSGIIWRHEQRYFLLSVGHVLEEGDMFIETRIVSPQKETLLIHISKPVAEYHLCQGEDFGWAELDFPKLSLSMKKDPRLNGQNVSFECYCGPLDTEPEDGEAYGFAKWNGNELIESTKQLVRDRVFEVCMEYDGIDEHTGFYRFIPMKHKGDAYHGCSGAPIAEPTGKIVGLLQGGREEEGVILGVPLKTFIAYLPVKE